MIYTVTLNPAIDKTFVVDHLGINEISRVQEVFVEAGGKGFNVSRALLRSGIPSKSIGFLGGTTGGELLEGLSNDGIDVIPVTIQGETRVNQVFLEPPDKSIKINARGPEVSDKEYRLLIQRVRDLVRQQDIFVLSGSIPPNVPTTIYAELIKIIRMGGGKVFLDSSGIAFQEGVKVSPDWIKPNLSEAQMIFPGEFTEIELLRHFQKIGVGGTILTLGSNGLLYSNSSTVLWVHVPKVSHENVVGAGDATVAGFLYGIAHDCEPAECAKWAASFGVASAHASSNCFGNFAEVEAYYQQVEVEIIRE
jgi:1-phosphofructokinase